MKKNVPPRGSGRTNELLKFLLVMKLAILITLITAYQVQAGVLGQTVSVSVKQTEIKKILNNIERNGDVRFLYNYELPALKTKVDFVAEDLPMRTALDKLFVNTELSYKVLDNNLVVIMSAYDKTAVIPTVIKLGGKVTGENGEPLSGVSILIKGTNKGTSTDNTGSFSLVADKDAVLVVSYIGYVAREIPIKGEQSINIKLLPSSQVLDQVV